LAAADCGLKEGESPPELKLAQLCERWRALPEAGGLLDQPAGLIEKMSIAVNVFNAHRAMRESGDWATWMTENPQGAEMINWVKELRNG
jgi:hypothetical protein